MAETELLVRNYRSSDEDRVLALWELCGLVVPWNDPRRDIERKMEFQPYLFFVAEVDAIVVATVMAGYEGHRGWINYLGVSPDFRNRGIGRRMMEVAEGDLRSLGCQKINLQVRSSNQAALGFYRSIGFVVDDVVSLGKRMKDVTYA